jgi:hypothetical protein
MINKAKGRKTAVKKFDSITSQHLKRLKIAVILPFNWIYKAVSEYN